VCSVSFSTRWCCRSRLRFATGAWSAEQTAAPRAGDELLMPCSESHAVFVACGEPLVVVVVPDVDQLGPGVYRSCHRRRTFGVSPLVPELKSGWCQ